MRIGWFLSSSRVYHAFVLLGCAAIRVYRWVWNLFEREAMWTIVPPISWRSLASVTWANWETNICWFSRISLTRVPRWSNWRSSWKSIIRKPSMSYPCSPNDAETRTASSNPITVASKSPIISLLATRWWGRLSNLHANSSVSSHLQDYNEYFRDLEHICILKDSGISKYKVNPEHPAK